MNKLKKMLLISSLILLASCGPGIPEAPETLKVAPIWDGLRIGAFYGRWMKSGEKVSMTLDQAKEAALICTDADSYAREELYARELRELAKKRCK